MAAYELDIEARIGEAWSATLTVDLASWSGWSAKAQIRYYPGAPTLLAELECDTSVAGEVTVALPDGATASWPPTRAVWDLLVKPTGSDGYVVAAGNVEISGRVTVPA